MEKRTKLARKNKVLGYFPHPQGQKKREIWGEERDLTLHLLPLNVTKGSQIKKKKKGKRSILPPYHSG